MNHHELTLTNVNELTLTNINEQIDEIDRYMENIESITSTPMNSESISQANNFKNYLISTYIQPDFIIEFCFILSYEKFQSGKLNVYSNFDNPYVALHKSLLNVLNVSLDLSIYNLFTINKITNDQKITLQIVPVDFNQPPPLIIIFLPNFLDIHQSKNLIAEWSIFSDMIVD